MSVNRVDVVEKIPGDNLHLQLLSCKLWIFVKENPYRKKNKKVNYALQHIRTGSRCMVDEERLQSFVTEVPIMQKPVHWFGEQINGLVSIRQELPSWNSLYFATCMYSLRYIPWLWQNNWHVCIHTSKEDAFN